jgi:hypothetical protein
VTSSWFFLSTLNYDARSTTHQMLHLSPRLRVLVYHGITSRPSYYPIPNADNTGYNDIALCGTLPITFDIVCYQFLHKIFSPLNDVIIEFDCTLWKRKLILTYMGPGISATISSLRAGCRNSVYDSGFEFLCASPPFTCAAQTLFAEQ